MILREYTSVQLGTLEEELQDLEEFWDERSFDAKKGLVSLLIKEIIWEFLSPRFFKLRIVWAYKEWGIEDAIFDRRHVGSKPWTKREEAIIESMYPICEQVDILRALSQRTWRGITVRASKLGVKREGKPAMVELNLSYQDTQFLEESGLCLTDFSDCNHTSWLRRVAESLDHTCPRISGETRHHQH